MAKRAPSKRSKTSGRRKTASGTSRLEALQETLTPGPATKTAIRITGWLALAAGVTTGLVIGIPELEQRAVARDLQSTNDLTIEFQNAPDWFRIDRTLPRELEGIVINTVGDQRRSARIREGLIEAHAALEGTHWFESLDQLRWIDADTIRVEGRWVRPAAVVYAKIDGENKDVLVDVRGHRLAYAFEAGTARDLPRIKGADRSLAPPVGDFWGDDVVAGIALHDAISDRDWSKQIQLIDVSNHGNSKRGLVLRTNGCSIIWGRSPDDPSPSEVPTAQKLEYLDYYAREFGDFEEHCAGGELDARPDMLIQSPNSMIRDRSR